jgi:nicotinic acid mononucleotide adenylyltransferase
MYSFYSSPDETEECLVVGTASLLDYLQTTEPEVDFSFCVGADAFGDLVEGRWKESARVLSMLEGGRRLLVLYRQLGGRDDDAAVDDDDKNRDEDSLVLLKHRIQKTGARLMQIPQLNGVSSSRVRACHTEQELSTLVVPAVFDYMKEHKLFMFAKNDEQEDHE